MTAQRAGGDSQNTLRRLGRHQDRGRSVKLLEVPLHDEATHGMPYEHRFGIERVCDHAYIIDVVRDRA